jgi:hypothetical protein
MDVKNESPARGFLVTLYAVGSPGSNTQGHDQTTHYGKRIHTNPGAKDIV